MNLESPNKIKNSITLTKQWNIKYNDCFTIYYLYNNTN